MCDSGTKSEKPTKVELSIAIGTKIIRFEPMSNGTFDAKFGRDNGNEYKEGYHVQYDNPDGSVYDSWSPKKVFEDAYTKTSGDLTFDHAFFLMKKGMYLGHPGWRESLSITVIDGKIRDNDGELFGLDTEDIERTDWRVRSKN